MKTKIINRVRQLAGKYVCARRGHRWGDRRPLALGVDIAGNESTAVLASGRRCRLCRARHPRNHFEQVGRQVGQVMVQIRADASRFRDRAAAMATELTEFERRGRFRRRLIEERLYALDWLRELVEDTYADLGLPRPS